MVSTKMIPPRMAPGRRALGFRETAEAAFVFLHELGFRMVVSDETYLRYESDKVFVNIYHGRSSFALSFEIGLLVAPGSQYYPEEVAALGGAEGETFFQASTPDRVRKYLVRLSDLLRRHGSRLLTGDEAEFKRLQEVRDRTATTVTRGYFLSAMREKSDAAWKRRDYRAVVEALSEIGPDMSAAERRKLQYAIGKIGQSR